MLGRTKVRLNFCEIELLFIRQWHAKVMREQMKILVTGAAGFIGSYVTQKLITRGDHVVGIDNLNDYYDVKLKQDRLARLEKLSHFTFHKLDISEQAALTALFEQENFDRVVHLAAQAGVRYSLENPHAYIDANLVGFGNILECCRHNNIEHLVFASSSSVYGANETMPLNVHDNVDHPLSLYAATKKANELMAHSYAHLYRMPVTGLRFFTVYGPWGRPDMAFFLFTRKILNDEPIDIFNNGQHARDFTYIDDIVEGVVRTLDRIAAPNGQWSGSAPDPASSNAPYRIYNIGNNQPVELMHFIACLENAIGKTAQKNFLPLQPGDVEKTFANIDNLVEDMAYQPKTSIEEGIAKFVSWYKDYYQSDT